MNTPKHDVAVLHSSMCASAVLRSSAQFCAVLRSSASVNMQTLTNSKYSCNTVGGIASADRCATPSVWPEQDSSLLRHIRTSQAHLLPSYKTSYTLQTARRDKRTLTVDISLTFPKLVSSPGGARRAVSGGAGMN